MTRIYISLHLILLSWSGWEHFSMNYIFMAEYSYYQILRADCIISLIVWFELYANLSGVMMVLDATLLNIQHHKVWIKGKAE